MGHRLLLVRRGEISLDVSKYLLCVNLFMDDKLKLTPKREERNFRSALRDKNDDFVVN